MSLAASVVLVLTVAVLQVETVRTAPATTGQWTTLGNLMPINPVHVALLHNGKVLIVSGSGNVPTNTDFEAGIWDPARPGDPIVTQPVAWDMFCNGMVVLSDGRAFINSGTLAYDPFKGELRSAVFDPATNAFTDVASMAHGRWYPTVTTLGDGRVMTFSGLTETGATNTTVEIFTPGAGWSPEYQAGWTPPLYPRMHLLPDGKVFYSGSGTGSRIFDPATQAWSAVVANTNYTGTRTYGTSVLLPLTPANGYKPRVMIMGGGNPATNTTEIIDLSAQSPLWQFGPPMSQPRIEMNATILPDGKVLAVGGSTNDEDATTASLNADLYDPNAGPTGTFTSAGSNVYPRLYHSNALLLPDATVLLVGGNPQRGSYEQHMEIYSPAYLFNADNTPATRPTIDGVSSTTLSYGGGFSVQTPDAADISSVVLVRPGAPTHAFDMEQRLVALSFSAAGGVLNVTAPPNGNIAPPGYYMLFVLNSAGVPSVATFVRLPVPVANQPPTATISSPSTDVTVQAGGSVSFSGTGTDPDGTIAAYAWTFPGGNPSSSALQSPGAVAYGAPGIYTASLTVTDNQGLASSPATRTITVPDFSLSATPTSQAVPVGGSANYTVTLTPGPGFAGSVAFGVSGLPAGATASFSPANLLTSGSTALNVSTTSSTPPGTYPLAVTGTTGTISHTVTVTLVVDADFSMSVSPASITIARGRSGSTTVTIGAGFTGTVTLAVTGLPRAVTGRFRPASIVNAGSSTLAISVKKNAPTGTYTLTITGTSGAVAHSVPATLVIQ
ncbi:MAG: galactose oxidase-like domain-containing protein [Betaproteobacteria bacterium]